MMSTAACSVSLGSVFESLLGLRDVHAELGKVFSKHEHAAIALAHLRANFVQERFQSPLVDRGRHDLLHWPHEGLV